MIDGRDGAGDGPMLDDRRLASHATMGSKYGLDGLSEQDDAFNPFQHAGSPSRVTQSSEAIAKHISQRAGAQARGASSLLPPHTNPERSIEQALNVMAMSDD